MTTTGYEYAVREDWAFHHGVAIIMPTGPSYLLACGFASLLDAAKEGTRHTVLRREIEMPPNARWHDWHEWSDENARSRSENPR
jgi:hypothetical protein